MTGENEQDEGRAGSDPRESHGTYLHRVRADTGDRSDAPVSRQIPLLCASQVPSGQRAAAAHPRRIQDAPPPAHGIPSGDLGDPADYGPVGGWTPARRTGDLYRNASAAAPASATAADPYDAPSP